MFRTNAIGALLLLEVLIGTPTVRAQGVAAQRPASNAEAAQARTQDRHTGEHVVRKPVDPDFKVVFWFGSNGLKHQVYDVRKGQYTQAVDDWVHEIRVDPLGYVLPARLATVREVFLDKQSDHTEAQQLAAAIEKHERQILGFGQPSRRIDWRVPPLSSGPSQREGTRSTPIGSFDPSRAPGSGGSGGSSNPPSRGLLFPGPRPFPRPP